MSSQLDDQLSRYGEYLEVLLDTPRTDELGVGAGRIGPAAQPGRVRWWKRGWVVAVGAAVAVIVTIGGTVPLFLRSNEQPPGTTIPAPSTTVAATPDTLPTTITLPAATQGWQTVEPDSGFSHSELTSTRLGTAAVGCGGVWLTMDGVRWIHSLRLSFDDCAAEIVEFNERIIAAGSVIESEAEGRTLMVWSTTDGTGWSEATIDDTYPGPYDPAPAAFVVGDPGLVVAVDTTTFVQFDSPGTDLWVTADGATWSYVPPPESGLEGFGMTDISPVGSGFVGLATRFTADDLFASVWTSDDGAHWSQVPGSEAADRGGRLLRFGEEVLWVNGRSVLATADGLDWRPVGSLPAVFAEIETIDFAVSALGVTVTAHRWHSEDVYAVPDTEIWFSADLDEWERIPDPEGLLAGSFVWQIGPLEERLLAVGEIPDVEADDPSDRLPRVWIWTPSN